MVRKTAKIQKKISRRDALRATMLAGSASLAAPALASREIEWRMVTSWPKNLPGPGVTAKRLAENITALSNGRLRVRLYAAGELAPALGVFDAVSNDTAQMGHTASFFWQGKLPASVFFTAIPFGLTPLEHMTWLRFGGGQQLWDKLYAPFNLKPLMGGNTGVQMGGWYKNPVNSLDDLRGLKIRMPGLGGEVFRKLGAAPVSMPPSDILPGLQSGLIDAAEFLGPFSDMAMGFYKVAKHYHYPGFHEPNGTGEVLLSAQAFDALPKDLQQIVEAACSVENSRALSEADWFNAGRLEDLTKKHGVMLQAYPQDLLQAARQATKEVLDNLAVRDKMAGEILTSYRAAEKKLKPWSKVSLERYYAAR